jgi:glycine cleavage system H protein
MSIPSDLKYSRTDEWVKLDGNIATIGITDYAQDQLSDVVFVEVAVNVGETVKKGTVCATIESVKAAADVNLPVSGKVTEVNEALPEKPELVNQDPYGQAWLLKVQLEGSPDGLMDADAYQKYLEERSH